MVKTIKSLSLSVSECALIILNTNKPRELSRRFAVANPMTGFMLRIHSDVQRREEQCSARAEHLPGESLGAEQARGHTIKSFFTDDMTA
jgi:hypothetical protein